VDRVREQLIEVLDLQECRFEYGHAPRSSAAAVARWHHHGRSPFVGRRAIGLPGEEIELRVFGNGQFYGRFMLRPKPESRPSLQARLVAVTLADQAGRAFGTSSAARRGG